MQHGCLGIELRAKESCHPLQHFERWMEDRLMQDMPGERSSVLRSVDNMDLGVVERDRKDFSDNLRHRCASHPCLICRPEEHCMLTPLQALVRC